MSDRVKGFLVALKADISEYEAEKIVAAIGLISGVVGVTPQAGQIGDTIIEMRVKNEFREKLFSALY